MYKTINLYNGIQWMCWIEDYLFSPYFFVNVVFFKCNKEEFEQYIRQLYTFYIAVGFSSSIKGKYMSPRVMFQIISDFRFIAYIHRTERQFTIKSLASYKGIRLIPFTCYIFLQHYKLQF